MEQITISNPKESDRKAIVTLYKANKDTLSIPFTRVFDEMMINPNFYVCKSEGAVVAFMGLKFKPRKCEIEIQHLCVSEEWRLHHIASTLILYAIEHLKMQKTLIPKEYPVVAYANYDAENNRFYDKLSKSFTIEQRKTMQLKRYIIDVAKLKERYDKRDNIGKLEEESSRYVT